MQVFSTNIYKGNWSRGHEQYEECKAKPKELCYALSSPLTLFGGSATPQGVGENTLKYRPLLWHLGVITEWVQFMGD